MSANGHARVDPGGLEATGSVFERRAARPLRVCMVAYTFYEMDSRVKRYAEALVERGDEVEVIALRRDGQSSKETMNGVRVIRIQRRVVNERSVVSYAYRILLFILRSMIYITRGYLKTRYDVIHVHSIPECLVFAAWIPKLLGARIILDIHDLLPELYASKFDTAKDSFALKCLVAAERVSSAFADHVIVANHLWAERLRGRSVRAHKCTTIMNFPDERIFCSGPEKTRRTKCVILYPGTLNWHQGVDIAIRAFSLMRDDARGAEFHIYGEGPAKTSLIQLVAELGLEDRVLFRCMLPVHEIVNVMREAELGVVPKRADSFGNEAFSTKILEFMCVGVPVVVSDTKVDRYYFNDSVVRFFKSGDEQDLAHAILALIRDKEAREHLSVNASEFVGNYVWTRKKHEYLELVDRLCTERTKVAA